MFFSVINVFFYFWDIFHAKKNIYHKKKHLSQILVKFWSKFGPFWHKKRYISWFYQLREECKKEDAHILSQWDREGGGGVPKLTIVSLMDESEHLFANHFLQLSNN